MTTNDDDNAPAADLEADDRDARANMLRLIVADLMEAEADYAASRAADDDEALRMSWQHARTSRGWR